MLVDAQEFGSPVLSVILKYLDGSQCEFSSTSSATLKCLLRVKGLVF